MFSNVFISNFSGNSLFSALKFVYTKKARFSNTFEFQCSLPVITTNRIFKKFQRASIIRIRTFFELNSKTNSNTILILNSNTFLYSIVIKTQHH